MHRLIGKHSQYERHDRCIEDSEELNGCYPVDQWTFRFVEWRYGYWPCYLVDDGLVRHQYHVGYKAQKVTNYQ